MNTEFTESTFTPEEMTAVRAEVRAIMQTEGLSQKNVSDESGIPYGTFTSWLSGKYEGRNDDKTRLAKIWLESRAERRHALLTVPTLPGFQPTPTATRIITALHFAQIMPDIAVIAGGAGIGKTTTAHQYQTTHPNVWIATMEPGGASANAMMRELTTVLGIVEKSATELSRAIGKKVAGAGGLLIVDEAQHLSAAAIEQLRTFHDKYGVGVALLGNESVYGRIGDKRKPEFAQVLSRIGDRITQARPRDADINMLIAAWGVTEKDEIGFLKVVARKPGSLRGLTKCLQRASMLAAGEGKPRDIRHIRTAFQRLEDAQ